MVIIGSQALLEYVPEGIKLRKTMLDIDYICSEREWANVSYRSECAGYSVTRSENKGLIRKDGQLIEEYEIAQEGSSGHDILVWSYANHSELKIQTDGLGMCVPLNILYLLKMSHRYKKNSVHFVKTMKDILFMRSLGAEIPEDLQDIYQKRMKETYNYSHPKLNVSSGEFFSGDGVNYIYEHDDIHDAIALYDKPAFRYYMVEGAEVMTSMDKFFEVEEEYRLLGVYEEACVLALERSQIPNDFEIDPEKSFMIALMKICTSITSGRFREYAWENYFKVVNLYHSLGKTDYIERFKKNQHNCRPYKGE